MVHGIEKFIEYFKDFSEGYVLIGGVACDMLLSEIGVPFRSTKDFDIVLIIESLDLAFGETLWSFIEDGNYVHREKSSNGSQFYRFSKPKDNSFPRMIELFSRKPINTVLKFDNGFTPIYIDDSIASLSAILLDDDYYDLLKTGKRLFDRFSVIDIETMILFKIKAWLDLNDKVQSFVKVDHRNIKKHKNDVFKLLASISSSNRIMISESIRNDILKFIKQVSEDKPDFRDLGIRDFSFADFIKMLEDIYL